MKRGLADRLFDDAGVEKFTFDGDGVHVSRERLQVRGGFEGADLDMRADLRGGSVDGRAENVRVDSQAVSLQNQHARQLAAAQNSNFQFICSML